jgi:predicted site-specific integrase-resolvase
MAQRPDLRNQRAAIEAFCLVKGFANVEFLEEVGGGLNFKRKVFLSLIDRILAGEVDRLIVAHKDRLVRFGFQLLEHLCNLGGCELVVLSQEALSPEQEMVQDLMTIVHCFSSRLYGLRKYKKQIHTAAVTQ